MPLSSPAPDPALDTYRLLVESVQDYAIFMLDVEGRVVTWNRGAERIKGYVPSEILGRYFAEFYCPEDVANGKPARALEVARREGRMEDEGWRVRKDGSRFWANVIITALYDDGGQLRGFGKVTRDLTARRRAEETEHQLAVEKSARATAELNELRLREQHERYRALSEQLEVILEGIADGVTVQDASGSIIFANSAAARVSGFASTHDLLHASSTAILRKFDIHDESGELLPLSKLPGRRVLAGEPSARTVMRVVDRESRRHWWMDVQATPVLGDDGSVTLAVTISHDISADRRREEQERYLASVAAMLAGSLDYEARLRSLAAVLVPGFADWCAVHLLEGDELRQVAVAHVDPGRVASARAYSDQFPPSKDAARGLWHVVRAGVSELYEHISDDLLQQGSQNAEHLRLLREAGMTSLLIVPIRSAGEVSGTITLVAAESGRSYDNVDLALAEELGRRAGVAIENARLYQSEKNARERLQVVAHAGELFSTTLDYERTLHNVVDISLPVLGDFAFFDIVEGEEVRRTAAAFGDPEADALIKQTRWARSERQDKNLCALSSGASGFHPQIDDAWRQDVATSPEHLQLLRRLQLCSMVTVPLTGDGARLGSLTVCFGRSGRHHTTEDLRTVEELARRAAVAVLQARLFQELQRALSAAEDASTIKDEFLATVSHELRTPLNAIVGWASLLRGRATEPTQLKGLDVIARNAQAQAKIIEDILDVSRIITGKLKLELESVDLLDVIRESVEVVRPSAAAKGITLEVAPTSDACLLVADRHRLQQVLWNLLSNAIKFTDAGGAVRISVARSGEELRLFVSDTGCGIEPEFLPHVFERFKQADSSMTRRVGGLGLGLAIVRHVVELHGGKAEARSEGQGRGTTVVITLPLRAAVPAVQEESPPRSLRLQRESQRPQIELRGLRVLVVEDERDSRELLSEVLEQSGARVAVAASAAEAFSTFQSFRPHVLVSDIGLPGEDGYSLIARIRALGPELGPTVPALALTAYTRAEDRQSALAAGFTAHLGKPVRPGELLALIAKLSEGTPAAESE